MLEISFAASTVNASKVGDDFRVLRIRALPRKMSCTSPVCHVDDSRTPTSTMVIYKESETAIRKLVPNLVFLLCVLRLILGTLSSVLLSKHLLKDVQRPGATFLKRKSFAQVCPLSRRDRSLPLADEEEVEAGFYFWLRIKPTSGRGDALRAARILRATKDCPLEMRRRCRKFLKCLALHSTQPSDKGTPRR